MTITEFAESRGVEAQAVNRYLLRHPEQRETCTKIGKAIELSEEAYELLDKQYPLPKPIMVTEGVPHEEYEAVQKQLSETLTQLNNARNALLDMKDAINASDKQLIQTESTIKLLEEKNGFYERALDNEKQKTVELQHDKDELLIQNTSLSAEIDSLKAELEEAKRPKSLFERIFAK